MLGVSGDTGHDKLFLFNDLFPTCFDVSVAALVCSQQGPLQGDEQVQVSAVGSQDSKHQCRGTVKHLDAVSMQLGQFLRQMLAKEQYYDPKLECNVVLAAVMAVVMLVHRTGCISALSMALATLDQGTPSMLAVAQDF